MSFDHTEKKARQTDKLLNWQHNIKSSATVWLRLVILIIESTGFMLSQSVFPLKVNDQTDRQNNC